MFFVRSLALLALLASVTIVRPGVVIAELGETRLDNPRASDATKVSAGLNHTCAVLSDESLWCWGSNSEGQLGLGNTTDQSSPARVGSATNWRSVSAGNNATTCAVNTSNDIFCWGFNASGQTGVIKTTTQVTSPTKVEALATTVQSVSVGSTSTCIVTTSGVVRCWGDNSYGQIGTGVTIGQSTHIPTAVQNLAGTYSAVAVGTDGACALSTTKAAFCWGTDLWGQRGDGAGQTPSSDSPSAVVVNTGELVIALVGGAQSNCMVIENNGATRCWGQNTSEYLRTTVGNIYSPLTTDKAPFSGVLGKAISVGLDFACLLKNADGRVVCGGKTDRNQVSNAPTSTGNLVVTTGSSHACVVGSDRRLSCWGANADGRVGNGTPATSATASVVTFGSHSVQTIGAEPVAPSAPRSVALEGRYKSLSVTWTAPATTGTAVMSNYEYRYSTNGGGAWTSWVSFASNAVAGLITGLTTGVNYSVQVRAVSTDGTGPASQTAGPVAPSTGCDPKNNCALGAIGPRGGTIVLDRGIAQSSERFIEAAAKGWSGSQNDPQSDWETARNASYAYEGYAYGWTLATSSELSAISTSYLANQTLLADWDMSSPNSYWSLSEIDNKNAYAGTIARDKTFYSSYRPVRYLDGPTLLAAPIVSVTATDLALSVSWTAPSTLNNGAVTDYQTRVSSDGGANWAAWVSQGLQTSVALSGLTSGASYRVQVRAFNGAGGGTIGQSSIVVMTPAITPASQTISAVMNTSITPTSTFSAVNFSGAISYAVTTGTLPTGLSIHPNTGVVSGTPSTAGSVTVTITATGTTGTATATITFTTAALPPGIVEGVWAIDGLDAVVVEWFAPSTGETATGYEYAISTNGGQSFSGFQAVPSALNMSSGSAQARLSTRISTGLTRGVETIFQVRAMNGSVAGPVFPNPLSAWSTWAPRATAKLAHPCDPMNNCEVGSVGPGGGLIVYDHGVNASWGRYIEAAPAYWNGSVGDPAAKFGCDGSTVTAAAGASQQLLGTGRANTAAIMASCSTAGIPARIADAYAVSVNGQSFDDWHLASSGELQKLYSYRQILGGWKHGYSNDDDLYASSTDANSSYFFGIGGTHDKLMFVFVRPIRYVDGPSAPSVPGVIASVGDGVVNLAWSEPISDGGNAVSGYQYRSSSNGGTSWGAWSSLGLVFNHIETALVTTSSYVFEVRALNRGGAGIAAATSALVPGAVSIDMVAETVLTMPSLFSGSTVGAGISYSVTNGTLPAGLVLNSATGAITGTPTSGGSSRVTITATVGAATAVAVVQFTIAAATTTTISTTTTTSPPSSSSTTTPPTTTAPQTTAPPTTATAAPTTVVIVPQALAPLLVNNVVSTNPSTTTTIPVSLLVTPQRQEQLTADAGASKILIGGKLVEVNLIQVPQALRQVPAAERNVEQITELRKIADSLVEQVQALLGGKAASPISVRQTPQGAVIVGLVTDPITGKKIDVPVEYVALIRGGGLLLMVAGSDGSAAAKVASDGVLEISQGGIVSVLAYGLAPNSSGEVVVMSTPRKVGEFTVAPDGGVSSHAVLPSDLGAGQHTVVVTVGDEAASLGFRVIADSNTPKIPTAGFHSGNLLQWALLSLLLGLSLLAVRRRQRVPPRASHNQR